MVHVLAVDDDAPVLALIRTVLALEHGWYVETAHDGGAARQRLEDPHEPCPDLVVLDIMMPGISGLEVLQWLRRHPHRFDLPVVMLTGRTGAEDETEAWHLGCDAYVRKPFRAAELVDAVGVVLSASPELRIARRRKRLEGLLTGRVPVPIE